MENNPVKDEPLTLDELKFPINCGM